MTEIQKLAVALFKEGFSCSQAVFAAYAPEMGIDREKSLKLSQAFGGGMAHMGMTCGAVTGAFLVIGLKHGRTRADDQPARDKTYALMKEFVQFFREKFCKIGCRELIGIDLDNPEEVEKAKSGGVFENQCTEFVSTAALWLENNL
ncbi:MAG: C-GCAxxG-C-C family protein [Acidobacteriota bacterium]|nr:C-GCAxxG-C-C family protein [Candidatus Aminicenantes bacterium]